MQFISTVFCLLALSTSFGQAAAPKPEKLCVMNPADNQPLLYVTLSVDGTNYRQDAKGCFTLQEPAVGSTLEFSHPQGAYRSITLVDAGTFKALHNQVELYSSRGGDAAMPEPASAPAPPPVENPGPDDTWKVVDEAAEYPGGRAAMNAYFTEHLQYPPEALEKEIQGKCYVKFVVDTDGKIIHSSIVKSASPELDQEALRLVRNMPAWIPAKNKGKVVKSWFTLPVTFRLQ